MEEARIAERVKLKRVTFGERAEAYRSCAKEHRLDASNVEGLLDHHILPVLGPRVAHEITTADLQALGDTIAAKRPLSGRNKNNKEGRLSPQTKAGSRRKLCSMPLKSCVKHSIMPNKRTRLELLAQCSLTGRTRLSLHIVGTVESAFKRLMPAGCACSMTGRLNLCWVMKDAGTRTYLSDDLQRPGLLTVTASGFASAPAARRPWHGRAHSQPRQRRIFVLPPEPLYMPQPDDAVFHAAKDHTRRP